MARRPCLFLLLFFLTHLFALSHAQSIGSFFTAIYLNGAPAGSDQTVCSGMGQSQYCCGSGQDCAWDDHGQVACCALGNTCQGSAVYGGGGGQPSPTWQPSPTTVYQQQWQPTTTTEECDCEPSTYVAPAPVVPATSASVQTSYYAPATITTYVQQQAPPQQTAVQQAPPAGNAEVSTPGDVACATVKTVTYANVGAPVKTVGCYIVINEASRPRIDGVESKIGALGVLWLLGGWIV